MIKLPNSCVVDYFYHTCDPTTKSIHQRGYNVQICAVHRADFIRQFYSSIAQTIFIFAEPYIDFEVVSYNSKLPRNGKDEYSTTKC